MSIWNVVPSGLQRLKMQSNFIYNYSFFIKLTYKKLCGTEGSYILWNGIEIFVLYIKQKNYMHIKTRPLQITT